MRAAVSRSVGPVMLSAATTSPPAPRTGTAIAARPGSSSSTAVAISVLRTPARLRQLAQRHRLLAFEHADEQIGAAIDGCGAVGRKSLELLFHAGCDTATRVEVKEANVVRQCDAAL